MCRCIYCNSEDLSVSDIISYALTGAKLTKKFVCHKHNAFTNENFEKTAIANLVFFRNSLGLTERTGNDIKYKANLIIDGITIPNVFVSNRASIYEDKKRLFPAEQDGKKVLIGNTDKLKQKQGVTDDNIKILDIKDSIVSVTFSIEKLFASDEMLRTISKIAYEWYCYTNEINNFLPETYQDIVDCILMKRPVTEFVEIVVDGNLDYALKDICYLGSHGLFEYIDVDGYKYVILNFWGIVYYKIRICNLNNPNLDLANYYNLYLYGIDGEKSQSCFGTLRVTETVEKSSFVSMPATQAIQQFHKVYTSKLEQLVKTTVLTLSKTKDCVDSLRKSINAYQQYHDFARLVEYEDNERVSTIRLLLFLVEHKNDYAMDKTFNENLKGLYKIEDTLTVTVEEKIEYLKYLLSLHERDSLLNIIADGIEFFDKIYANEKGI
ncbi:hypothetical protein [Proteiniborus sp. MB09-C3]|uniref:hypothetical protein n=1 Tax=Proteiniborus sp. MB09-C3 TaxID=3050072 RepID=UPI0025550BE0|nr:hypothetical protein [Proteiniborus sp. MB09-C3]WIV13766.1 hypothetical protein QO263_08735 [Proteiniborus sp. MB09-C3]